MNYVICTRKTSSFVLFALDINKNKSLKYVNFLAPPPTFTKKNSQKLQVQHIKDEPSKKQPDKKQQQVRKEDAKYVEPTVNLESYYYGIYHQCVLKDCAISVEQFKAQVIIYNLYIY